MRTLIVWQEQACREPVPFPRVAAMGVETKSGVWLVHVLWQREAVIRGLEATWVTQAKGCCRIQV